MSRQRGHIEVRCGYCNDLLEVGYVVPHCDECDRLIQSGVRESEGHSGHAVRFAWTIEKDNGPVTTETVVSPTGGCKATQCLDHCVDAAGKVRQGSIYWDDIAPMVRMWLRTRKTQTLLVRCSTVDGAPPTSLAVESLRLAGELDAGELVQHRQFIRDHLRGVSKNHHPPTSGV